MRFTINYKLFLTLLLTTFMVAVTMVILARWSFERGFLEYINKVEQEVHDNLVERLGVAWAENGDWEFIERNPRRFLKIFGESLSLTGRNVLTGQEEYKDRPPPGEMEQRDGTGGPGTFGDPRRRGYEQGPQRRPSPRRNPLQRHGGRLCLLDADKEVVGRCRPKVGDLQLKAIEADGKLVGYLGILPKKKLSSTHDLRFSQQHHRFLLLLALAIVVFSALVAFPVSRLLVKPVKTLTEAMARLAAGNYQTRVEHGASDELGDLSRDFNSLARTLEANEMARRQWIADISHELRTPLSVLRGEIEALQDGVRKVNPARLDSLHGQIMNLHRLVDDLYELSMSDIGALNYHMGIVDIAALLKQCLESFCDELEDKKIVVHTRGLEAGCEIRADAERMIQLFSNLLTNSLRYTDDNGKLNIRLERNLQQVVIEIEDSAPAVKATELPQLFDRLYRVENSRNRRTGGTGLGLAICKNIVEAHGGSISASLASPGGLRMRIELPGA